MRTSFCSFKIYWEIGFICEIWMKGVMKSLIIPQTTLFPLEILSSLLLHVPLFKEFLLFWLWVCWLCFVCKLESEEEIVISRFWYWPFFFVTQKMQMFTIYLLHAHLIIEAHCRGIYIYLLLDLEPYLNMSIISLIWKL